MSTSHFSAWMVCGTLTVFGADAASGQTFPTKPIRIVTSGTGGGTNFAARIIASGISGSLGQQVIVDNREGGLIAGSFVSTAAPDGYTLFVTGSSLWVGQLLRDTPFDAVRDFAAITLVASSPNILVVHPSLPARSVKDLISLARSKPDALNYSSGSPGGSAYLAGELFKSMAHVNITRIHYKSGSVEMADLMGGYVQMTFGTAGTVKPYINSGKLRALAVTSAEPSALAPGVPTVAVAVPGYESGSLTAIFAPAKTPMPIINRLNQEITRAVNGADVRQKFFDTGVEVVGSSPNELASKVKQEITKWGKVIRDAGIRGEKVDG